VFLIKENIDNKKMNIINLFFNGLSILIISLMILFYFIKEVKTIMKENNINYNNYKIVKIVLG
jgi:uncharacterized membrane protein